MRPVRALLPLLLLSGALAAGAEEQPAPREIVRTAFDRMFNYPSVRSAEFRVYQNRRLVATRSFDVVYQRIQGRGHTLLRFVDPEYLRGTSLLMVEEADGAEDTWIYRESARKIRRINARQRADSFYGTDFTFEDLEHHDWSHFDVRRLGEATRDSHRVHVLEAVPHSSSQYARLRMEIEEDRLALLRIDFFRSGSEEPIKTLTVPADTIERKDGVLVPSAMRMTQHGRDRYTEVRFLKIEPDPGITPEVFSSVALERSGVDLFDLVRRLERGEDPD